MAHPKVRWAHSENRRITRYLVKMLTKAALLPAPVTTVFTYSPDGREMFCVYHGRTTATGDDRVVFVDRMKIEKDGRLVVAGPTTTPQPLPSGTGGK